MSESTILRTDSSSCCRRRSERSGRILAGVLALLAMTVAACVAWWAWAPQIVPAGADAGEALFVYCAAGIKPPLEEAARQYSDQYHIPIRLQYGSSGSLESQIRVVPKGDLYIPAAIDPFLTRLADEQLVAEHISLGRFRLVLAVQPGNPAQITGLSDLLTGRVTYALANDEAAVSKKARELLQPAGQWQVIKDQARVFKPTVTEVAGDIQTGGVDAGFLWDSTARQFGLETIELPELKGGDSEIAAGVLTCSTQPSRALHFARYLAAPDRGGTIFQQHYYDSVHGDRWAEVPELTLFSGGVNRLAIEQTLKEFEQRERCRIAVSYNGCGVLVSQMKAGAWPDAYFACDESFVEEVSDRFGPPTNVSATDMVILVPKGNPRGIATLSDLGQSGLLVGMADEQLSALGFLTRRLLEQAGVYQAVVANRRVSTPTADLLVVQLVESNKLDAAIVYRANCSNVRDRAEIIAIDHPSAHAVQPFVIHDECRYPQLTGRLLQALLQDSSRQRFRAVGFTWLGPEKTAH